MILQLTPYFILVEFRRQVHTGRICPARLNSVGSSWYQATKIIEYIEQDILGLKLDLKFQEFKVGQTFKSRILIDKDDFQKYISFAKTKNILHEKPELAAKEEIKGPM